MATIKLGELLLKAKVLQEVQLEAALAEQRKWGGKLGEILVRMNFLSEDLLIKALSKQLGLPVISLDTIQGIPPHVKAKVPVATARDLFAVPIQLREDGKVLVVAVSDPLNMELVDTLRAVSGCRLQVQIAGRAQIQRAFARFYEGSADGSDFEGSFKVIDSSGRTLVKSLREVEQDHDEKLAAKAEAVAAPRPAAAPVSAAAELLRNLEEVQRKEVAALKALMELMIEKGVFTRDEYLAKIRR